MDTEIVLDKELTIQEVAERSGLSVHTLRYYERIGLLDRVERATSGHRRYDANDLAWIAFLIRLRATGMSIQQMQDFAYLRRQGPSTMPQRLAMLEEHHRLVSTHMQEMAGHLAIIEEKIVKHQRELAQDADPNQCFLPPEKYRLYS
jgi:DNA-binding transcriptional MerR regulator